MPATPPVYPIAPPKVTRTLVQLIKHLSVRNVELTEGRRVKESGKEQTQGEVLTEVRRLELKLTWVAEGWRRGHVFFVCGLPERPSFELDKFITTCKKTRRGTRKLHFNISNVSLKHGD